MRAVWDSSAACPRNARGEGSECVAQQDQAATSRPKALWSGSQMSYGILTGKILERQRDQLTAESKYRINGKTIEDRNIEALVKEGPTGKVVIVTVYEP